MTEKQKNDFFYVCSLIEYIARQTQNKRGTIVKFFGREGIDNYLTYFLPLSVIKYPILRRIFIIRIQVIWNALIGRGVYWTRKLCI